MTLALVILAALIGGWVSGFACGYTRAIRELERQMNALHGRQEGSHGPFVTKKPVIIESPDRRFAQLVWQ